MGMEKENLKELLKRWIAENEKSKQKNYERNKGLNNQIVTDNGLINDGYYKGKIQAYKNVLDILEKED